MNGHAGRAELELYVVGALEGARAEALEEHCASCDVCADALAREARLEIAFEQVATQATRSSARSRPIRAAAYGAAGLVAMAAAAMLWFGRGPIAAAEGSGAAVGGQVSIQDGAIADVSDELDGG